MTTKKKTIPAKKRPGKLKAMTEVRVKLPTGKLKKLMEDTGADPQKLADHAFALLEHIVEKNRDGYTLALINDTTKKYRLVSVGDGSIV